VRGEGAELVGHTIGADQHGEHAGGGLCALHIHTDDTGMRMRGQNSDAIGLLRQVDVLDIAPLPGEETLILDPLDRLPDPELGHSLVPCEFLPGRTITSIAPAGQCSL
jgi:hypothetical protein